MDDTIDIAECPDPSDCEMCIYPDDIEDIFSDLDDDDWLFDSEIGDH